jgi:hypothetical protein
MIDQLLMLLPSMVRLKLEIRYTMLSISLTSDKEKGVRTDRMRISLGWIIAR